MCVVSAVMGWGQKTYPNPVTFPLISYPAYQELIEKARKYDELTGQKYCPDPAKEQWHKELEQFMLDKYGLKPL